MKKVAFYLLTVPILLLLSGCLTSLEPFYQEGDIQVDDRLVGDYLDQNERSQSPTHLLISKVDDYYHKGQYYVTIASQPGCEMKFGAVLFQIGTNRFLDLLPQIEACDYLAANPPSLIGLLQAATLQPMHMVVKVDTSTNGIRFGFADHPSLLKAARNYPEYFQPLKPEQLPRMVANTKRQREFLLRFGGDTNIFKFGQFTKPVKDAPGALMPKKMQTNAASPALRN